MPQADLINQSSCLILLPTACPALEAAFKSWSLHLFTLVLLSLRALLFLPLPQIVLPLPLSDLLPLGHTLKPPLPFFLALLLRTFLPLERLLQQRCVVSHSLTMCFFLGVEPHVLLLNFCTLCFVKARKA